MLTVKDETGCLVGNSTGTNNNGQVREGLCGEEEFKLKPKGRRGARQERNRERAFPVGTLTSENGRRKWVGSQVAHRRETNGAGGGGHGLGVLGKSGGLTPVCWEVTGGFKTR